ncbi:MAG: outer membrane protein assembly factor BamA [Rhodospirillales bacterium]|nr:outer membrane protein assembly factor BamA [Rhodospirillales bacterium]MBT4038685.1 outer membrane protein assembly factor BamA [Rhodospirillales bacterium]MBT4627792.1 outer membrane protein assembly factor BamA [Rhodospirillales bacterium]MBT5350418.1 outer membrane protein assembly factor BamA [Rhodospirillales bacterium]MBT5519236.1 outer membrane protein assembly factor BamA [Rhodospirillales bacterium]
MLLTAPTIGADQFPVELAQTTPIVKSIEFEGANRIEPDTIRSYLLIYEGDEFSAAKIDRSLKSLFATGLFADVGFSRRGDKLIVSVVENPIINRIAFEGNEIINDEIIDAEVTLRPRVIYTRTKIQNDVQRIITVYRRRGRFSATVEPKVIQLSQNRVDLVFEISEGDPTEIKNIRFVGNSEFDDDDLRDIVQTKESRWYRVLSSDDVYDPDRMTLDRELLRQFYLNEGFADFRVISGVAELTPDQKDFFITFTVDEGERYTFGDVVIDARLRDLDADTLVPLLKLESGEWYSSDLVDDATDRLSDEVGTLGYAFVDVRPKLNRDRAERKIDLTFEINEGPRVFVERIDIVGNLRTIDKVIRREMRLVEGDAFNSAKMRRSRQRIQNLNYFEKVSVERTPGSSPDKSVINVSVAEKSTGSLSIGAGFSSDIGPLAEVGVTERNLMGHGQTLALTFRIAAEASQLNLKFTEPYFMDREVQAGFDVFRLTKDVQDTSSYDSEETGFGLRSGYAITEDLYQKWGYSLSFEKVTNVDDDASIFIQSQEGEETLSQLSHTLSYDKRDRRVKPSEGYNVVLVNDLAGLGGTKHFLRNTVSAAQYFELADDYVLSISGKVGVIEGLGEDVNLTDRFFVGGYNLRGFASSGIGPRDTSTNDSLGGEWMYTGRAQLRFPTGIADELGVEGRVFTDFGTTSEMANPNSNIEDSGSLRASVGIGLGWDSPFGPIGMDLAVPIAEESYDDNEMFRINLGTTF